MTRKQRLTADACRAKPIPANNENDLEAWARIIASQGERPSVESVAIPQLIITLSPTRDALQLELPGVNGLRRVVPVRTQDLATTCLRILCAQAERKVQIGLDGAPTQRQVRHWERHDLFPDDRCPFCIAEGRTRAGQGRPGWRRTSEHTVGDGSIKVRKLLPKSRKISASRQVSDSLADDLGL